MERNWPIGLLMSFAILPQIHRLKHACALLIGLGVFTAHAETSAGETAVAKSATAATTIAVAPEKKEPASGKGDKTIPAKPKPPAHDPQAKRFLNVAGIGEVSIYAPQGEAKGLALFASGDGGWNLGVWDMARTAASLGYWVAGFSTPGLIKALDASDDECADPAGLLESLGDSLRSELTLPDTMKPVLIGYSSGATVVYAALAEAGDERFGGGLSLGFCPDLIIRKPWCEGAGLNAKPAGKMGVIFQTVPQLPQPWIVLQGEVDQVCDPLATVAYVKEVKGGQIVSLPKVGHGYSVPRNWMPQYRQGLIDLLNNRQQPHVALSTR